MIPSPQPIQPDLGAIIGQLAQAQGGAMPPPPMPPSPMPPASDMGMQAAPMAPPPPTPPKLPDPAPMGFSQSDGKRTRGGVPVPVAASAQRIYKQEEKKDADKNQKPMGEGLKKPDGWGGGNG